jgi:hypothetical protein
MPRNQPTLISALALTAVLALGGCGGSSSKSGGGGASSTNSEAASAATGDIPDNQVFLTYRDQSLGYSLSYPEGWSRTGSGRDLTFRDKDNSIHLVVSSGAGPTPNAVKSQLVGGGRAVRTAPRRVTLKHGPAIRAAYLQRGPPNTVTDKRPFLSVDRYVYAHGGKVATLDLSTPKGVDNVDAYRMIAGSFRWR